MRQNRGSYINMTFMMSFVCVIILKTLKEETSMIYGHFFFFFLHIVFNAHEREYIFFFLIYIVMMLLLWSVFYNGYKWTLLPLNSMTYLH